MTINSDKKGFTLVEVMIAIILSAIALFGIETLIVESLKDWRASKEIVDLQRDLDVASYKIKGVLEEATSYDTPLNGVGTIYANYKDPQSGSLIWRKKFERRAPDNALIFLSILPASPEEIIINTLQSITFTDGSNHSIRVDLAVVKNIQPQPRQLNTSFLIYLRNPGGG